jgi:hypothetical protein
MGFSTKTNLTDDKHKPPVKIYRSAPELCSVNVAWLLHDRFSDPQEGVSGGFLLLGGYELTPFNSLYSIQVKTTTKISKIVSTIHPRECSREYLYI